MVRNPAQLICFCCYAAYHGGMAKKKTPNGTWVVWDNVERVMRTLMAENNGLIPSRVVFRAKGLLGLLQACSTYHGGLNSVRERLGVARQKYCKQCQTVKSVTAFRLKRDTHGSAHRDNICVMCSSHAVCAYRLSWKGRAAEMHRRTLHRARATGREHDLTKEWLYERLVAIDFKCEVTGIALQQRCPQGTGFKSRYGASVDRIDSARGYTRDNVRIVTNRINVALGDLTDGQFEEFAVGFLRMRGWVLFEPGSI